MIVSRCLSLRKLSSNVARNLLLQNKGSSVRNQIQRYGHDYKYYYRCAPTDPPFHDKLFEALGGIIWWWVLWHAFTDYHEVLPHTFPDPSKWTDEELGVPPIDE